MEGWVFAKAKSRGWFLFLFLYGHKTKLLLYFLLTLNSFTLSYLFFTLPSFDFIKSHLPFFKGRSFLDLTLSLFFTFILIYTRNSPPPEASGLWRGRFLPKQKAGVVSFFYSYMAFELFYSFIFKYLNINFLVFSTAFLDSGSR